MTRGEWRPKPGDGITDYNGIKVVEEGIGEKLSDIALSDYLKVRKQVRLLEDEVELLKAQKQELINEILRLRRGI